MLRVVFWNGEQSFSTVQLIVAGRTLSTDGNRRENIRPGMVVSIILKKDQASGSLTSGIVKDILTSSAVHPHGIKVRLEGGQIGRVKRIVSR